MFNRVEFKIEAKENLTGNWTYLAGLMVIYILLAGILAFCSSFLLFLGVFLTLFITAPLQLSLVMIAGKLYRGEEIPVSSLFDGFKLLMKAVGLSLWTALWTFLWSLLFIIPGIMKAYSYSLATFCLVNNPELTVGEALKESIRITEGYKGDLFILDLSWIGWELLCAFTCGLGVLFLNPYMMETKYIAFHFLKENSDGPMNSDSGKEESTTQESSEGEKAL